MLQRSVLTAHAGHTLKNLEGGYAGSEYDANRAQALPIDGQSTWAAQLSLANADPVFP
jgi:hypothetical protein